MEWNFKDISSDKLRKNQKPDFHQRIIQDNSLAWEPIKVILEKKEETDQGKRKKIELLWEESYDCAFCRGRGEKPRGSVCSVCKGKKRLEIKPPVVRCAKCKGRGEERPRTNITCTSCRGRGYVSVIEPVAVCPSCRGRGATSTSNLPCVQCRGSGVITIKERERYIMKKEA